MTIRRRLTIVVGIVIAVAVAGLVFVHSNAVQRSVIGRISESIAAETGWRVEIENPRMRLWPARFVAEGLTVSTGERLVGSIERLEMRWSWSAILGSPRRIEDVEIEGIEVDLRDPLKIPVSAAPPSGTPVDPWRVLEIGRLEVTDGRGAARIFEMLGGIDGLRAEVKLIDGIAALNLTADTVQLVRSDRRLDLGPVVVRGRGSADGIILDEVTAGAGDLALSGRGELKADGGLSGVASFTLRADLERSLGWWDPNLATGFDPTGVLDLEGNLSYTEDGELEASAVHRGDRFTIAGYALDELELGLSGDIPQIRAAGATWGSAAVSVEDSGLATVHALLADAPVERILAFIAPQAAVWFDGPVALTGEIDGTVSYPFAMEALSGRVDLEIDSAQGRVLLEAAGAQDSWRISEARLDLPGASLAGQGAIGSGGTIEARADLRLDGGAVLHRLIREWLPDLEIPALGGGPMVARVDVSGLIDRPRYDAEFEWTSPVVSGTVVDSIRARFEGDPGSLTFSTNLAAAGVEITADGTAELDGLRVRGEWSLDLDSLQRFAALVPDMPESSDDLSGRLKGRGGFVLADGRYSVDGSLHGYDVGMGVWRSEEISTHFSLDENALELSELGLSAFGGSAIASGRVGLGGFDSEISLNLEWREIDLARLPADVVPIIKGTVTGALDIDGTVAHPSGQIDLEWRPDEANSAIPKVRLAGALDEGFFSVITEEVTTEAGSVWVQGEASIGLVPRPEWLWPEAPDEALRISARGHGFHSDAVVDLLGLERPPVSATGDLEIEATWHPSRPEETRVLTEIRNLRFRHVGGELEAKEPVVVRIMGDLAEIEPVTISGAQTHILMSGGANLRTGELNGLFQSFLDPAFARNIPYPVQIHEPIGVSATVKGTLDRPQIGLDVNHPGGAIVFRDPPLQVRDLALSAELIDGIWWINDGRARVNEGTIEIGGGWDADTGQGIVAEIDNVVVFVEGILSAWSGTVAIEPEPDRFAKITGELNLVAGLWDQDVSLGGALFGPSSLDPAGDDPLYEIALDLDVRGRGIVRVENNIGRFDARWDVLRVTGNAAEPEIRGKISIAPGGRLSLAGQRVTVRRGSLVFTGDPSIDPVMEIVPESDIAAFGGGDKIDTTSIATQGLVSGLAGALGFENETLQPAEISVEVEKDSSQQLMFGQRLSHNIALFFATNTTDVQDRTSMFQLWNLPGLKGLALQAYQKTLTDEAGGNLVQRFQWGGSSLYEDRHTIRKLKLDGDWPIGKRRLRKATGFRRGQPYDPFLPFVAKVRMERELAGAGYQEATVTAHAVESNDAWTMVFECEPGTRREVVFKGDAPPRRVREEVTAMYQPPPLERVGFRNMVSALDRHLDAAGYPESAIVVELRGDEVVAEIHRGDGIKLSGPVVVGASPELNHALQQRLGSTTELAMLEANEARAKRVVERVLVDLGYPDAVFESATRVALDEKRSEVRIEADLGARAVVEELVVTGDDPLGLTRADDFSLQVGTPLSRGKVDLAASQLRAGYDSAGYSDARVTGSMVELAEGDWKVIIHVEPGGRRWVREVEIVGAKYTNPKVLRSGITVEEGEILRNSDLDTAAVRIANFAPIERVDVTTVPQGTDGAKVVLEVAEKPRWTTEVGAGWSTESGAQARFGIRDDNLIGRGLNLNLRGRWDQKEWLGFVVASLPPPPGKRFSFTTTGGFSRGDAPGDPTLTQDEPFWSFEVTRWMGRGDIAVGTAGEQLTGYYRFSRTHTYEKEPDPDAMFQRDFTIDTGLIGARYVHDRFDSPFDPTRGYGVVIDAATSRQVLGSDFDYWTTLGNGSMAVRAPLASILVQSLRIGVAEPLQGQPLIRTAKFFAGGQGSIRGFDRDSVGPVTFGPDGWDPAGGGALLILNEELRIPVKGGFRAAIFADIGQVWKSWGEADWDFAVGAGVGIRWATPIGPVWADVAWPIVNPDINPPGEPPYFYTVRPMSSSKPKFYIGIGRPF